MRLITVLLLLAIPAYGSPLVVGSQHSRTITVPGLVRASVADGKVAVYPGYGYSMSASGLTDVELDGVSIGAVQEKFDIPLGLHTVKAKPAGVVISSFEFVH